MSKPIDPWELLREVRNEWLRYHDLYTDGVALDEKLLSRVDAALAVSNVDGIVKCEFCKGSGKAPYKKPWSPRDVLGNENE